MTQCAILLPMLLAEGAHLPASALSDPAFDHFYNLEYDQALRGFMEAAARHPLDPAPFNHIAQTILYREMFRAGMLQTDMLTRSNSFLKMPKLPMSDADRQQFMSAVDRAADLARARLDRSPNDTSALYSMGVSDALRGNFDFAVRKAYLEALREMTAARRLHNRATELQPDFIDAQLLEGAYDYIVGSLPLGWKMLGFLGGFHGNRERGIATLERVAGQGNVNRVDAAIFLAAIYRRERRPDSAVTVLRPLIGTFPRNYLLRMELAEMYGDEGNRAAALDELDQMERLRCAQAPGYGKLSPEALRRVREEILIKIRKNAASIAG